MYKNKTNQKLVVIKLYFETSHSNLSLQLLNYVPKYQQQEMYEKQHVFRQQLSSDYYNFSRQIWRFHVGYQLISIFHNFKGNSRSDDKWHQESLVCLVSFEEIM